MSLKSHSSLLSLAALLLSAAAAAQAPHNYRIAGVVVDAAGGQPLSRARVIISANGVPDSEQSFITADDGRFAFEALAPAHYVLSAEHPRYRRQFYKEHGFFSTAIIVGPDLDTAHLRFELRPDAAISGQVLDEMNEPVRNAQMILFLQGLQTGSQRTWRQGGVGTDDQGHYRFSHLQPGTYVVAVSAHPWYAQPVTHQRLQQVDGDGHVTFVDVTNGEPALDVVYPVTFFPGAPDIAGAAHIAVHPGDELKADFTLQPVPALHMTIHTPAPAEGENFVFPQVSLQVTEGVQQPVQANTQVIEPGLIEITGLPPGRLNLGVHFQKGKESTERTQVVQLTQDADLNLSEAGASEGVSGVVKTDDGSALPEIGVQLHNRATGQVFHMPVDANGEFALKNQQAPAGTYDVFVNAPSALGIKSVLATGAKVSGRSLELSGSEDVRLAVLVAKGSGTVTGVALKDAKPLEGVMVVLVPEVPEHNLGLFRRDQSDSDGSFNLRGILPGKYTVVAIENGWDLDWLTPAVLQKYLPGGQAIEVAPGAKLEVKVNAQP